MGWLRDTFPEPGNDSTEVERIRYARAYILEIIGGYLMPDLATGEFSWGFTVLATLYREMCGAMPPTKAKIGEIQAVISDEFFQNLNIWHVKVSLLNYATVEMHQTDRVLQ
ncbi:hypothetical protein Gotur_011909 [Gossypium turneri]